MELPLSAILMSWDYFYQQYSCHGTTSISNTHVMELTLSAILMSWNYLHRQDSCHGTTSIGLTHVMELPLSAIPMSWNYLNWSDEWCSFCFFIDFVLLKGAESKTID